MISQAYGVGSHMHHQPRRLVVARSRRSMLSPDRLQGIDGLGQLGSSDDDSWSTDEELENDSDYFSLVSTIIKAAGAITPAALNLATQLAKKKGIDVSAILGMGQARATAVQTGQASMPTGAWIGIGVGAIGLLALVFMMGRR